MQSPSGIYLRRHAQKKYDAIIKSAGNLFLKQGYTRTSMDAVAKDARVSKQTVYSYFTNKDVLFCHMIEAEFARYAPSARILANPSLSAQEALFKIGQGFIEMMSSKRGASICRLVLQEADRHTKVAKFFYESGPLFLENMLAQYLQQPKVAKLFHIEQPRQAAANFFALIKGGYHLRLQLKIKPTPTQKELDAHVRETVRLFFKLYGK